MKKLRNILLFVLVLAMVIPSMTGCKKEEVSSDGLTTVTVWTNAAGSKAVMTKLVNDWNETTGKEKGIKIDYQVKTGGDYTKALDLAIEGGTAPDLFLGGNTRKYALNGNIWALDELPGGPELIEKSKEYLAENRGMVDGKTYKLPVSATTRGLIYNKEMFVEAGIVDENGEAKPPETLAELREVAKKLTDAKNRKYGIIFPAKWSGWYESDVTGVATASAPPSYNPATNEYKADGVKPIIETYLGIKEDGSFYPGESSIDNDSARALFAEGGIGMKVAFSFDLGVLRDQFPAKIEWGVAPFPVAEKGVRYKQVASIGYSETINKQSKVDPEILMEVLSFLTSDETITQKYLGGVVLPHDWSIVDGVDDSNVDKNWKAFAELVDISIQPPLSPSLDTAGLKSDGDIFNEIWAGKITVDQGVEMMNKNIQTGLDNYYKNHPDEDRNQYYDPSFVLEMVK